MIGEVLVVRKVAKAFAGVPVLRDISLAVERGEIVVLLGPSGSGKTTLLRVIAGLVTPDAGHVLWQDAEVTTTPPHLRGFGFVFQDFALFPHKNVAENVGFGLKMLDWPADRRNARVREVLKLVNLAGMEERSVNDLSGGEQQRVALARSLAPSPQLLLLDEPLGALDRALRERLMLELRGILKKAGSELPMTALYVTHDQAEAYAIADRIAILRDGRLEQIDRPRDLYRRPASPFVARFLGLSNLLTGRVVGREPTVVATAIGPLTLPAPPQSDEVTLLLHPDAARRTVADEPAVNTLTATLVSVSFRGRYQIVEVKVPSDDGRLSQRLAFEFDADARLPAPGSPLTISIDPAAIVVLNTH